MLKIRNSEIAKFKRCPRSWYISYYLGLEPEYGQRLSPRTFDTGNAVHAGLEAYYKHEDPAAAIDAHKAEMYENLSPEADMREWEKVYKMAHAMVEHYPAWLDDNGLDIGEETVAIEKQIEFQVNGVTITCRPDRLVSTAAGLIIEDWKSGDIKRPFMFESDWQMLNYGLAAWAETGQIPVGARHRRLNRSMHTARATADQYAQHVVHFTEARLRTHAQHLERAVADILATRERLDQGDPVFECAPNRLTTCNWDCSAAEVCTLMDDGGDWQYVLINEYRKREDI